MLYIRTLTNWSLQGLREEQPNPNQPERRDIRRRNAFRFTSSNQTRNGATWVVRNSRVSPSPWIDVVEFVSLMVHNWSFLCVASKAAVSTRCGLCQPLSLFSIIVLCRRCVLRIYVTEPLIWTRRSTIPKWLRCANRATPRDNPWRDWWWAVIRTYPFSKYLDTIVSDYEPSLLFRMTTNSMGMGQRGHNMCH